MPLLLVVVVFRAIHLISISTTRSNYKNQITQSFTPLLLWVDNLIYTDCLEADCSSIWSRQQTTTFQSLWHPKTQLKIKTAMKQMRSCNLWTREHEIKENLQRETDGSMFLVRSPSRLFIKQKKIVTKDLDV